MEDKKYQIRKQILLASHEAGACHIGSALSCVDILVELFYNQKILPSQFLFGKASGVATYYVILADLGIIEKDEVADYLKNYPLPSVEVPGIVHSFGSVGHALSVAAGMALRSDREIYVLLSDGDCQEGSTLEACAFINHHNIQNLYVFVDDNGHIACGKTEDILKMEPIWQYMASTIPNFNHVKTVKGAGVDFMEDNHHWHYLNLDDELLDRALINNYDRYQKTVL